MLQGCAGLWRCACRIAQHQSPAREDRGEDRWRLPTWPGVRASAVVVSAPDAPADRHFQDMISLSRHSIPRKRDDILKVVDGP